MDQVKEEIKLNMQRSLKQNSILMDEFMSKELMDQVKVKFDSIYSLRNTYA